MDPKIKERLVEIEKDFYQAVYDKINTVLDNTEKSEELALEIVKLLQQLVFGLVLPNVKQRVQIYQNLTGYKRFKVDRLLLTALGVDSSITDKDGDHDICETQIKYETEMLEREDKREL